MSKVTLRSQYIKQVTLQKTSETIRS